MNVHSQEIGDPETLDGLLGSEEDISLYRDSTDFIGGLHKQTGRQHEKRTAIWPIERSC